jgi:hypothetical protein
MIHATSPPAEDKIMLASVSFNTRLQNFCQKGFDGAKILRPSTDTFAGAAIPLPPAP